ncbi:hypothetical protein LPL18_015995 [Halomonas sp. CUBES01]|uniref:hypothetical protein n=1 Tax=Halomonas sp. CUBES01 TaxID=2897340 RepID=UPI002DDCF965|nr:hypothetical protein [Halomonas sp. CUBES01]MEC4768831.1 hypothetical protein [Halomonas sp. CUBES01]
MALRQIGALAFCLWLILVQYPKRWRVLPPLKPCMLYLVKIKAMKNKQKKTHGTVCALVEQAPFSGGVAAP